MDPDVGKIISVLIPILTLFLSVINAVVTILEKRRNERIRISHEKELLQIKEQLSRYNSFVDEIYKKHLEPMLKIITRASFFYAKSAKEKTNYLNEFDIEYNNLRQFLTSNFSSLEYSKETNIKLNNVMKSIEGLYEELSNINHLNYNNIMNKSAEASNAINVLINLNWERN